MEWEQEVADFNNNKNGLDSESIKSEISSVLPASTSVLLSGLVSIEQICDLRGLIPCGCKHNDNISEEINNNNNQEISEITEQQDEFGCIGIFLLDAAWNDKVRRRHNLNQWKEQCCQVLKKLTDEATIGLLCHTVCYAYVLVDVSDESYSRFIGDNFSLDSKLPVPPHELPILAVAYQTRTMIHADIQYVELVDPIKTTTTTTANPFVQAVLEMSIHGNGNISMKLMNSILHPTQTVIDILACAYNIPTNLQLCSDAIRLFVAGDRSSVGKSSICLGILGTLLSDGQYKPEDIAYIKPATQSESIQLIQLFCENNNISCMAVGPLVYYRGFTRAYLAGMTNSTTQLLQLCQRAVDRIAIHKKFILIDGVGFPAVGSICGTCNRSVARACGYPQLLISTTEDKSNSNKNNNNTIASYDNYTNHQRIPPGVLLVGGSGVGAAVDAFNLNASYFESGHVPVIGAVFNKLALSGFYSLESCKEQITLYFQRSTEQIQKKRKPFGFIPICPFITNPKDALPRVDEFFRIFRNHVDINGIIEAAKLIKANQVTHSMNTPPNNDDLKTINERPTKQRKLLVDSTKPLSTATRSSMIYRSRQDIESKAIRAGAAPSA